MGDQSTGWSSFPLCCALRRMGKLLTVTEEGAEALRGQRQSRNLSSDLWFLTLAVCYPLRPAPREGATILIISASQAVQVIA